MLKKQYVGSWRIFCFSQVLKMCRRQNSTHMPIDIAFLRSQFKVKTAAFFLRTGFLSLAKREHTETATIPHQYSKKRPFLSKTCNCCFDSKQRRRMLPLCDTSLHEQRNWTILLRQEINQEVMCVTFLNTTVVAELISRMSGQQKPYTKVAIFGLNKNCPLNIAWRLIKMLFVAVKYSLLLHTSYLGNSSYFVPKT